jgi:hypothetical protein
MPLSRHTIGDISIAGSVLVLQSTVVGHIITVDPQVISHIIRVPVLEISANPYNEVVLPPSLDDLREFFHAIPQGKEPSTSIRIGALSPSHRMLAKIIQQNIWPVARCSDLILKRAQFVYVVHLRLPFCLCKHILGIMLEARNEGNVGLPFGCLLIQIILQSGVNVTGKPKMKIQQPISKQTLMKSNAQLRRDDSNDEVPIAATMPLVFRRWLHPPRLSCPLSRRSTIPKSWRPLLPFKGG